jgi:uncharacterized membrane protein YjgN (DUF898 family)
MSGEPRGAGRAGGLLFLAIVLFVAYLAVGALTGLIRFLLGLGLIVVLAALALNVVRRG